MSDKLRTQLVTTALTWESAYCVIPSITCAVSEYDAARLVGLSHEAYGFACKGRTSVSKGHDFTFEEHRYQIKAARPSGKKGSHVTLARKARNYDWDIL